MPSLVATTATAAVLLAACASASEGSRFMQRRPNQILFSDPAFRQEEPEADPEGSGEERSRRGGTHKRGLKLPDGDQRAAFREMADDGAKAKQCVGFTAFQHIGLPAASRAMRAADLPQQSDTAALDAAFEAFIAAYGRTYGDDPEERARRRRLFEQNVAAARQQQLADPSATYGVNQFMDEDMAAVHSRRRAGFERSYAATVGQSRRGENDGEGETDFLDLSVTDTSAIDRARARAEAEGRSGEDSLFGGLFSALTAATLPTEREAMRPAAGDVLDWRAYGVVSPVKNQRNCGSCWSFSVTGNIESLWVLSGNNATLLSEEELIACDNLGHNEGCFGGLMQPALAWIRRARGGYISTAESYPFTSGSGRTAPCEPKRGQPGAYISTYSEIKRNEDSLRAAVLQVGPISIGIDSTSWDFYNGGIMTSCRNGALDHAALVVGYDTVNNPPYWIVKNSWGREWGEGGYLRIKMGQNLCRLADISCTAVVPYGVRSLPLNPVTPKPNGAPMHGTMLAASLLLALAAVTVA